MLVPLSWLRDFAYFDNDTDGLVAALNALGMVVEGVEHIGGGLEAVVVAKVLMTRPHPDADRVQLVDVDAGGGETLQVVCGAFNFTEGDLVPLATIGAVLPNGMEIARRQVRGQWSNGMLCSAAELKLGPDGGGIHVLSGRYEPGTPVREALGIEPDVVFDLDITANRPDAMCVAGVARDLAAWVKVPFQIPETVVTEFPVPVENLAKVTVESTDLCPRFTARVIEGVAVGPSPQWMQRRLTLAGMRPINNVVDASNYVMLELGQPTHPYDLDKLPGDGILVRAARPGEVITTLDGVERRLGLGPSGSLSGDEQGPGTDVTGDCLICDATGAPVGIGGIMGGGSSEISAKTTSVLLEAAYFMPMAIARTSKRLKVRTEASARFERGTDPEGIDRAVAHFCTLMGSGEVARGMINVRSLPTQRRTVRVRTAKVNGLLDTRLNDDEIRRYLAPIGFEANSAEPGVMEVTIPSWRPDASLEVDIIEEVARHHGYANIGKTLPEVRGFGGLTPYQRDRREVRWVLVGQGIDEAMNPPLVAPGDHERAGLPGADLVASDPMMREESVLRRSLLPGLLRNLAHNASHRIEDVRLFEIGHVFLRPADDSAPLPDEREHLAVALSGQDGHAAVNVWRTLVTGLRLQGKLEGTELLKEATAGLHPGRSARIQVGDVVLGYLGEIHPQVVAAHGLEGRVAWIEVDLRRLLRLPRDEPQMRPISRQPSSDIDLAFVLSDELPAAQLEDALRDGAGELLVDLRLFDVYSGAGIDPGYRSLAYRLRFQALDRTLTDTEVGAFRTRAIDAAKKLGAALRG